MRSQLLICLSTSAATIVFLSSALAQTGQSSQSGMLEDPPAATSVAAVGEVRPMPTESPIADPAAVLPSVSLEDLAGESPAGTASRVAPAGQTRAQPFPAEEEKP